MEFIESRLFTSRLYELAKADADVVLAGIQADLLEQPERGRMVPGLGGIRKGRMSNPVRRKGKRGGFRYMYLYVETREHIHLLLLFDKSQEEDLSQEERAQLREIAAEIRRGG